MAYKSESLTAEQPGATVRRTLSLGNYEGLAIEYPIDLNGNIDRQTWEAIYRASAILTEWAELVGVGYQLNIGKSSLDRIRTETQLAKQKLDSFKTE